MGESPSGRAVAHTAARRSEWRAKLWPVVKREYMERVRTRWFLVSTIFAPILFGALFIVPAKLSQQNSRTFTLSDIVVIDATTSGLGERVAQQVRQDGGDDVPPFVRVVPADSLAFAEHVATQEVMQHLVSGYVVIDSATLLGLDTRYAGRQDGSAGDMRTLGAAIRTALIESRFQTRGLSAAAADSLTQHMPSLAAEHIGDEGRTHVNEYKILLAAFVAFFLYMSLVLFGQSMLSGVMEEKTTRVSEVVLSSVRPETLLAGKVIGVSAVGLTQQLIWIAGAAALYSARTALTGARAGGSSGEALVSGLAEAVHKLPAGWVALVVLFFVLGFVFFGSLYAAVGSTVNSESDARQAAQPVLLLLVMTVVLVQPVIVNPSGEMARVLSILPFSAPVLMPLRMAISAVPATEVVASIVVLLLGCAGAVWVAARIYRIGLLMYGTRPTLRELGRWIRQG